MLLPERLAVQLIRDALKNVPLSLVHLHFSLLLICAGLDLIVLALIQDLFRLHLETVAFVGLVQLFLARIRVIRLETLTNVVQRCIVHLLEYRVGNSRKLCGRRPRLS